MPHLRRARHRTAALILILDPDRMRWISRRPQGAGSPGAVTRSRIAGSGLPRSGRPGHASSDRKRSMGIGELPRPDVIGAVPVAIGELRISFRRHVISCSWDFLTASVVGRAHRRRGLVVRGVEPRWPREATTGRPPRVVGPFRPDPGCWAWPSSGGSVAAVPQRSHRGRVRNDREPAATSTRRQRYE
jgi:hypothetical protein